MDENIVVNLKETEKKPAKLAKKGGKKWLVLLICGIVGILIGVACLLVVFLRPKAEVEALTFPEIPSKTESEATYSLLTGEKLAEGADKNAPVFCIQTPNGMDGARPQSGLTEAGVIFEAIAEAGITRFAALYQNPSGAVIGPIRSLRMYYLEWDTPFDCTIVHAGGAADAVAAVSSGGYRNFDESYTYMFRGTYSNRLWNNLFITSNKLKQFNSDRGYNSSDLKGFARMTPEDSEKKRVDSLVSEKLEITKPTDKNTSKLEAEIDSVNFNFGNVPSFNVTYAYNAEKNVYERSYRNGLEHQVYTCPSEDLGDRNPEDVCSLTTLSPSVVIAMIVQERRAADGYHEAITTTGTGDAYIFQNGTVVEGSWSKSTKADQIKFFDEKGEEMQLAPGQTIISAVPNYGSVEY